MRDLTPRAVGRSPGAPAEGGSAAVPAEQRTLITSTIENAEEQLLQLRGVQTGPTANVARQLLRTLRHSADLIENAWKRTALAAANAGVLLEEVAQWAGMSANALRNELTAGQEEDPG